MSIRKRWLDKGVLKTSLPGEQSGVGVDEEAEQPQSLGLDQSSGSAALPCEELEPLHFLSHAGGGNEAMCEPDVSQEDEPEELPLSWLSPQDPNAGIAEPENTEADPKLVPLHPSSNHGPGAGAADFWNMDSLQRLATDAAIKGIANSPIKMRWEKGPLAPLFTDLNVLGQSWADPPRVGMLDAATPATLAPAVSKDLHQSQRTMAKKRLVFCRLLVPQSDMRARAMNCFKMLVLHDPMATKLGRTLLNFAGTVDSNLDLAQIFADVFSNKATGTLLKRSQSLMVFHRWLQTWTVESVFTQKEQALCNYVCHLRQQGAGATTATHFLEALRFSNALFEFSTVDLDSEITARVKGACHAQYMTKRKLKQATILSVDAVAELERKCAGSSSQKERVICGHFLFCLYSVCRWADSMNITDIQASRFKSIVILEAETAQHKTSMTKEAKTRLLPFTALGVGLTGLDWVTPFVRARRDQGLENLGFFLASWSDSTSAWASEPMSTGEATCWLREILEPHCGTDYAIGLTVHGLKATMLSWAAKSCMFTREERTLLGHHVEGGTGLKSTLIYSRDAQIELCAKIHTMLGRIRSNQFSPDKARAERLFELVHEVAEEQDPEPRPNLEVEDSGSDADLDEEPTISYASSSAPNRPASAQPSLGSLCWVHIFSQVTHWQREGSLDILACGRRVSCNFRAATDADLDPATLIACAQCSKTSMNVQT